MRFVSASRLTAAAVVALSAGSASATLYTWNFTKNQPQQFPGQYSVGPSPTNPGGTIESINSTFDSVTKRLTFDALFSGTTGPGSSPLTSGFWLVLNKGPNPKNHGGELAIFYFDAQSLASPKMTVYGYNGVNGNNSWQDGDAAAGTQSPELIKGSLETGYINQLLAQNVTINGTSLRRLKFDINATDIINFNSAYDSAAEPWFGTGFDELLGVWFHHVDSITATYDSGTNKKGKITSLSTSGEGYLDGYNFMIPAPGTAALLGMAGLLATRRRRQA